MKDMITQTIKQNPQVLKDAKHFDRKLEMD